MVIMGIERGIFEEKLVRFGIWMDVELEGDDKRIIWEI